MSDLIRRQAAIRWVKTECNPYGKPTLDFESGKKVIEHLKQMPSAEPEQRWIPCSERLPSKADHTDDMVLVCYRNGSVRFNTYMNGWAQGNPVAWMPLPEPYRGERTEE